MENGNHSEGSANRSISTRAVDATVAAVLIVFGAVIMYSSYQLGAGWGAEGPQSGYFPFYIGLMILISAAVTLYQSVLGKADRGKVFVEYEQLKPVFKMLAPTLVYVLGVQLLGIYVASTIFIAGFMRIMGKYSWLKSLLVGGGVSVFFFWMFERQFLVPLHKGPIEAWLGF